jgi:hypothetical protein
MARRKTNIPCSRCKKQNCQRERMTVEAGYGPICSACYIEITNAERRAMLGKPCGRKNRRPNTKGEAPL